MVSLTATTWLVVLVLAVVAAATDVRTGRVPNAVTFGAALLAIAVHVVAGDPLRSTFGWLAGLALFLPLFALGGLGAGDVKLLAAFGAWLGPMGAVWTAIYAAILGGVLALAVGASHGYLREACRNLLVMLGTWRTAGLTAVPGVTLGDSRGPRLAYAVPISLGALLTLWLLPT